MKKFSLTLVFLFTILPLSEIYAQEVIVNSNVSQTKMLRNTLRAIFGMRLHKWPDGSAIKVFVLRDDDTVHIKFSKSILHMFPYQLRRAWDRQVYSGTGQAPNEVASIEEMRKKVAGTPGAIGYLPGMEPSENEPESEIPLRVLHVR